MFKTIILLITALIVLPYVAYQLDPALNDAQLVLLKTSFFTCLGFSTACFLIAEITGNCSQVDKIWSITPIVYAWQYAYMTNFSVRLVMMAVVVTVWGVRLTYNFSRRGGYSWPPWAGEEDYRWEILRCSPLFKDGMVRLKWFLFNFFFISYYQNILIWLITVPAVYAAAATHAVTTLELSIAGLMLSFILFETIADQQQFDFQTEKYRRIKNKMNATPPYSIGFIQSGLWGLCAHPNYACEQAIWITFYLLAAAATGNWLNGSAVGAVLLCLLFQGSADFSEEITVKKYPHYQAYIDKVPRFVPAFRGFNAQSLSSLAIVTYVLYWAKNQN